MNRMAFSREDVEDAKRGRPAGELSGYAAARGLEFLEGRTPAGFRIALPCDEERQFSVMRGVLPGGAYGVLAHEALGIEWTGDSSDWNGTFYGVRVTATRRTRKRDALAFVPAVGNFFMNDPVRALVLAPCSVAAVRLPQLAGTRLRIDTRGTAPPYVSANKVKLGGSWRIFGVPEPDPALAAGPVADLLAAHGEDGLFQVIVESGTLLVRRNGYLDEAGLDELARAAGVVAAHFREVGCARAEPLPFTAELPAPPRTLEPWWDEWAAETAGRLGLALEDPAAYHRAFPALPVPGEARVVMRGDVPGVGSGRLVVHREGDSARPAVLLAAPPGTEPTPPGGVPHRDHGLRVETCDGLLAAWSVTSYWGTSRAGDLDAFCRAAAAVL